MSLRCVFQVWLEQSRSQRKHTLMRWWLCGTAPLTSCWEAPTILPTSTCGQYLLYCCSTGDITLVLILWHSDHSLPTCLSLFRGVGCIFYEMATGRPLFPGSTVEEELHFIFKLLGENHSTSVSSSLRTIQFLFHEFGRICWNAACCSIFCLWESFFALWCQTGNHIQQMSWDRFQPRTLQSCGIRCW